MKINEQQLHTCAKLKKGKAGFCAFWFCIEISKGHNDLFASLPQSVFQDWVYMALLN